MTVPPASPFLDGGARGIGLATVAEDGAVLDVWYPRPELVAVDGDGTAPSADPGLESLQRTDARRRVRLEVVHTVIDSLATPPTDTADAYLRLHLLSHRLVAPRTDEPRQDLRGTAEQRLDLDRTRRPRRRRARLDAGCWPTVNDCRCSAWTSSPG